jgi:hypothetical protein
MLFTTDLSGSVDGVLFFYRCKDACEKLFCQIKVDMGGGRLGVHSGWAVDGKVFVLFVACVLCSVLLVGLSGFLSFNSMSLSKVLCVLGDVVVVSCDGGGFRFVKVLTRLQKDILGVFDAVEDIGKSLSLL